MTPSHLLVCLAAGIALSFFFYGGLWITILRLPTARHPGVLALGSLLARFLLVLSAFVLLSDGHWQNAALLLAGLIAGRIAFTRYLRACT